jgi:hypothetical protein
MDRRKVNVRAVKHLVRDVLGCSCPDEVFEQVEVKSGSAVIKSCSADYEINVGGRLLVVLCSDPPEVFSPARLEKMMVEGRNARDARNFHRFRLVLKADAAADREKELSRILEGLPMKDDRLHVHVIDKTKVRKLFRD